MEINWQRNLLRCCKSKVDYLNFKHLSKFAYLRMKQQYTKNNFPIKNNNQLAMAKKLAFDFKIFPILKKFCEKKCKFLSSVLKSSAALHN